MYICVKYCTSLDPNGIRSRPDPPSLPPSMYLSYPNTECLVSETKGKAERGAGGDLETEVATALFE